MENLLDRVEPRTGTGVKLPMLRLDSTNSSSNFLRLIDRVELGENVKLSTDSFDKNVCVHGLANLRL